MFLCSPLTSHFVTHNNNLEQKVLDHNYTIKFHSEEKALKQRYFQYFKWIFIWNHFTYK